MRRQHANAFSHQPGRRGGYVSGLTSFSDNMERGSAQTDLQNKELESAGRAAAQEERRTGLASRPAKALPGSDPGLRPGRRQQHVAKPQDW